MTVWLFDLGNTRLKCAPLLPNGVLGNVQAVAHAPGDDWLATLPQGALACVASVAPEALQKQLQAALQQRFTQLQQVLTESTTGPLTIAYPTPAHLGVDRYLALLGACDGVATLLVGVGTALTVDLLDAQGRHCGGRIAPSPQLMRESLHARAPHLPAVGGRFTEFADDTVHALASGCDGAALALVEDSLQAAQRLLGERPRLLLHGGGADVLRARLPAHVWCPDAVLHGLARWHALRMA